MTRPSRRKTARSKRGYTLIEVMMAVAVMTAGAMALMSLHQIVNAGNLESRQLSTASHAASVWVERLQRDSMRWNTRVPAGSPLPTINLALGNTRYLLNNVDDLWFVPTPEMPNESIGFDHFGRETRVAADMRFCTNVRLAWVYPGAAMRADVRVWYARNTPDATTADLTGCPAGLALDALTIRTNDVFFVYASTVLRWTPLPTI